MNDPIAKLPQNHEVLKISNTPVSRVTLVGHPRSLAPYDAIPRFATLLSRVESITVR